MAAKIVIRKSSDAILNNRPPATIKIIEKCLVILDNLKEAMTSNPAGRNKRKTATIANIEKIMVFNL